MEMFPGPVSWPLGTVWGVLRVVSGLLGARLLGRRESAFFDPATGKSIREPEIGRR